MSLHQLVNRQADDFLAMCAFFLLLTCSQKMKNNYVYGLSNPALRQAQEGVVELHLPPVDMTAVLKEVDREFVKQHPLMKKVLEEVCKVKIDLAAFYLQDAIVDAMMDPVGDLRGGVAKQAAQSQSQSQSLPKTRQLTQS